MHGISTTVAQANRFPHSQSCEGVLPLGGVANGVLPSHSGNGHAGERNQDPSIMFAHISPDVDEMQAALNWYLQPLSNEHSKLLELLLASFRRRTRNRPRCNQNRPLP